MNAGWAKNISGMGDTTIHVAYDRTNDLAGLGSSAHSWVVGLDQAISSASTNIFVAYENAAIDTAVTPEVTQSISTFTAGMAVKF